MRQSAYNIRNYNEMNSQFKCPNISTLYMDLVIIFEFKSLVLD